ncbi:ATP-dependent Clp protease ATP-binding subunit [soil metagenome]
MEFTQMARKALGFAQEIASKLQGADSEINTDDLFAGVAAVPSSLPARLLADFGVGMKEISAAMRDILKSEGRVDSRTTFASSRTPKYALKAKEALEKAESEATANKVQVGPEHIMLGILANPQGNRAFALMERLGVNPDNLRKKLTEVMAAKPASSSAITKAHGKTPTLDEFCRNITQEAADGKIDPIIGRQKEIARMIQILGRKNKPNPVLIGEPGVGKTAIAEGLALQIVAGDVPSFLMNTRIFSLDLMDLVAGTKYRGEFEDRLKKVIAEATQVPGILLLIDELHNIVGAGAAEGAMDGGSLLKPLLAKGELHVIGTTTLKDYKKIEKDAALARRFLPVTVGEPSVAETIEILKGLRETYEKHHDGIRISDAALEAAAVMSDRYITDYFLPDKALDLIDEAGTKLRMSQAADGTAAVMTEEHIAVEIEAKTGIPVGKLNQSQADKLLRLPETLHTRVIGQEEAIQAVAASMQTAGAGLNDPNRPIASFMFLGPTGVGKTELAKALAAFYYDKGDAMVRIDMSEYMEKHTVSRLIGSPPGYVGYDDGGQLTEAVRRQPYSVVLFDEIEKAHPDVFNILLQVLDDGRLTDSQGRTVDFKNTIVIMTSNVGAKAIQSGGKTAIGIDVGETDIEAKVEDDYQKIVEAVLGELKTYFRPEFLNRLDGKIVFRQLTRDQLKLVIDLLLIEFQLRLAPKGLSLSLNEDVKEKLLEDGYQPELGARPLKRALSALISQPLSKEILEGNFAPGDHLIADLEDGKVVFNIAVSSAA